MKDLAWWFVEVLALQLEPVEREAVVGDLIEARTAPYRAVSEISGLVMRRQFQLWKSWRPWVAALGLAFPTSLMLMATSVSVSLAFQHMRWQQVTSSASLPSFTFTVFLLVLWSWTAGFVVSSISRRTLWTSCIACLMPCVFCFARFRTASLPRISLFLFLLPALFGIWRAARNSRVNFAFAGVIAVSATISTIYTFTIHALTVHALTIHTWSAGFWVFNLALLWPSWYIVTTAAEKRGNENKRMTA